MNLTALVLLPEILKTKPNRIDFPYHFPLNFERITEKRNPVLQKRISNRILHSDIKIVYFAVLSNFFLPFIWSFV